MVRCRTSQPRSKSKVTKAAFSLSSSTHRCRVTLSLPINSCRRTTTPRQKLITFALHSAFCFVTNIVDVPLHLWEKCLAYVQRFIAEASRLLTRCRGVGDQLRNFLNTSSLYILGYISDETNLRELQIPLTWISWRTTSSVCFSAATFSVMLSSGYTGVCQSPMYKAQLSAKQSGNDSKWFQKQNLKKKKHNDRQDP